MDDKQLVLAKKFVEKERKKLDLHFFIQDQQLYQRRTCSKQFRHDRKLLIKKYKEQHTKLHKGLLCVRLKNLKYTGMKKGLSKNNIRKQQAVIKKLSKPQLQDALRYIR